MSILGFSAGFHDASATVIDHKGDILFAGHSERYSKIKNDKDIHYGLMEDVLKYCGEQYTELAYYERPLVKQLRRFHSGEGFDIRNITARQVVKNQLCGHFTNAKIHTFNHHLCHAAAGFQTSPFDRATVVVIDAIGEFDTISIWGAEYVDGRAKYTKLWGQKYPHSIGLFYTAMTERVGLKPMEDEYILMGMAAYGDRTQASKLALSLIDQEYDIRFKHNLHIGVGKDYLNTLSDTDIAAGAQELAESLILNVMFRAKKFNWSNNLVYMGGVALNCAANSRIGNYFNDIWIMPNPGDAGSSLGAAALAYGSRINWTTAFLGHNIPGVYPVTDALDALLRDRIVGVASGRAEFGPRALGNRSLLADPRGHDIKDLVNGIKRRQKFRPFAPVILEELVDSHFIMPSGWRDSRYMQSVSVCRNRDLWPAIVHADGTSRVQSVPKDGSGIRELLENWYAVTGCPMLLNTSLNVKGEPIVNDRSDADRFEQMYNVRVVS